MIRSHLTDKFLFKHIIHLMKTNFQETVWNGTLVLEEVSNWIIFRTNILIWLSRWWHSNLFCPICVRKNYTWNQIFVFTFLLLISLTMSSWLQKFESLQSCADQLMFLMRWTNLFCFWQQRWLLSDKMCSFDFPDQTYQIL